MSTNQQSIEDRVAALEKELEFVRESHNIMILKLMKDVELIKWNLPPLDCTARAL